MWRRLCSLTGALFDDDDDDMMIAELCAVKPTTELSRVLPDPSDGRLKLNADKKTQMI